MHFPFSKPNPFGAGFVYSSQGSVRRSCPESHVVWEMAFFFFFASYCSAFRYFFLLGTFSQHLFFSPLPVIFPSLLLLELLFLEKPNQEGNTGFSGCSAPIQLRYGMWDFPRPGIKPMSPTLAGRFRTTGPPGKSCCSFSERVAWSKSGNTAEEYTQDQLNKNYDFQCLKIGL